jgi:hypothetical protein
VTDPLRSAVYTVTVEIPLGDLEALHGAELPDVGARSAPLRKRLLGALRSWSEDNPDLLQGARYSVEYDDERGVRRTRTGRIK